MFNNKLKHYEKIADQIEVLSKPLEGYAPDRLKNQTVIFKERLKKGETIDMLLPEAFAAVKEASKRTIDLNPYKVQMIGALALNKGNIAEMKTGEGKTLVAPIAAYLNALEGKGVHIVTVNDYLAKRDKETMTPIFEALGMTVGLIQSEMNAIQRREAYNCDVTYVTNNELGFDYLRDNMARHMSHKVLRPFHYCIVDEVDSILIDEARTPLVVSGAMSAENDYYELADEFIRLLSEGEVTDENEDLSQLEKALSKKQLEEPSETGHYIVNKKEKQVHLTKEGIKLAEAFFKLENYADPENAEVIHYIENALKAHAIFKHDIHYIVKDSKVEIVDEFTGRILKGRRFNNGLHQAIEQKEGVELMPESKTLASITYQNLFRLYKKIAGMTGTAKTEEIEFRDLYGMRVISIPTNKPIARIDHEDVVFITKKEKYTEIAADIKSNYEKGRPVLVGTTTVEMSMLVSGLLDSLKIPHNVLNARFHDQEAEIISCAGQKGAVTVATNMAGRGTDIKLGDDVISLGGLKVIGTERHESRRIDNQLRGRSGRQGDPGETVFYISLEDDLMKLFGANKYMGVFKTLGNPEGQSITHPLVTKAVERAQKLVESRNYSTRKMVMEYDNIINIQRKTIYGDRDQLLEKPLVDEVLKMIEKTIEDTLKGSTNDYFEVVDSSKLTEEMKELTSYKYVSKTNEPIDKEKVIQAFKNIFMNKIEGIDPEFTNGILKAMMLDVVDNLWSEHIDILANLQRDVNLFAASQIDPMQAFASESYKLFKDLTNEIKREIVRNAFRINYNATYELTVQNSVQ